MMESRKEETTKEEDEVKCQEGTSSSTQNGAKIKQKVLSKEMDIKEEITQKLSQNVTPKEEPKVVEINSDTPESESSDDGSEHNVYQVGEAVEEVKEEIKTYSGGDDRYANLEARVQKIEEIVKEMKYSMDVLKGFGAIPHRMPTDEEREEVLKRQDQIKPVRKSKQSDKNKEQEKEFSWDIGIILGLFMMMFVIAVGTSEVIVWLRSSA